MIIINNIVTPSAAPTKSPTKTPTLAPTAPTLAPTFAPTAPPPTYLRIEQTNSDYMNLLEIELYTSSNVKVPSSGMYCYYYY